MIIEMRALNDQVCDGCWKRGRCEDPNRCRCPCEKDGWSHADKKRGQS